MADSNVFIEGAAEGAFVDALNGLPPWATESTAWKIQGVLEKQLGVQNKMLAQLVKNVSGNNGTLSPADQQKANKEFETLIKNLSDANKEDVKERKRRKEREEANKRSILTANKLKTSGEKLTYVLTGLATVGAKVLQAETQYIKTYDDLYKSGINVLNGNNSTADGFKSLNQMVNITGMRLETLQKSMVKYASALNAVGATKFTKTLAQALPQLKNLGYNSEEAADLMGSYIDSQQGFTDLRRKTETQIAQETAEFGARLNKMSLALGVSREQLLENNKVNSKSADIFQVAATAGPEAAKSISEFTAGMPDKLRGMINEMAAAIDPVHSQAYKELNAAGTGGFANQLGQIVKQVKVGALAPIDAAKALGNQTEDMLRNAKNMNSLWSNGEASSREANAFLSEMYNWSNNMSQATERQTQASIDTKAASAGLQTEFERTAAILQAAFSPMVSQVNAAATGLKLLNDQIYRGIGAFEQETKSWIGLGLIVAGFGATLAGLISKVGRFASLFSSGSAATAAGGAAASGASGAAASGGAAAAGGVGLAAAGLIAMPAAIAAGGAYLQHEMNTPEGRSRRVEEQKKRLAEKKEILRAYKEQGATGKAVKQVEDEIAQHEKLITDLSVDRAKVQTQVPRTKTPSGSTIAAPIVETEKKKEETVTSPSAGTVNNSSGPVKQAPPANTDINSQIAYQNSVLEQILESSKNLVSVNKDILKYTRVQS